MSLGRTNGLMIRQQHNNNNNNNNNSNNNNNNNNKINKLTHILRTIQFLGNSTGVTINTVIVNVELQV